MRRAVHNPPNRHQRTELEWLEPPPDVALEVREVRAKSILSRNDSPDLGFRYSANPYQGCYHGCTYCYARPSHQYLELGAGTDFERIIQVKTNAPQLLRAAFDRPSWRGELLVLSGNTDCYQPLEAQYGLTRQLLEVCLRYRNPVGLITKGRCILRDVDLLAELARAADVQVWLSIAFDDDTLRRRIEPYAAPVDKRFEAIARLHEAGVSTGVAVAPVIPGLNDSAVASILQRARRAGAQRAFMTPVRLAPEVAQVFFERLEQDMPERASKVKSQVAQMRGGHLTEGRFGVRMGGHGPKWALAERMFQVQCQRLGLCIGEGPREPIPTTFSRPGSQLPLF